METLGPILIGFVGAAVIIGARWVLLRVLLRPSYRRLKLPVFFGLGFVVAAAGAVFLHDEPLLEVALAVISLIFLWGALGVVFQWPGFRDSPPPRFREYAMVRVARMNRAPEQYPWELGDTRIPSVGEAGTIIDVRPAGAEHNGLIYVVEGPIQDDAPAWIAEFLEDELEPI